MVMLQYTHPDADHIVHMESCQPCTASPWPPQSPQSTSQRLSAVHPQPPQHTGVAMEASDLSSVEGDLRMQLQGSTLVENQLYKSQEGQQQPEEARTPQPAFAWQGNPAFRSPGTLS